QHTLDAGLAGGSEAIEIEPPDRHRVGTKCNAFDDISASAEAPVDDDLRAPVHGVHHLLQNVDRSSPMIELSAAMIDDIDAVYAVLAGDHCVLGRLNAFDDHWNLAALPESLDLGPAQHGLIALRRRVGG